MKKFLLIFAPLVILSSFASLYLGTIDQERSQPEPQPTVTATFNGPSALQNVISVPPTWQPALLAAAGHNNSATLSASFSHSVLLSLVISAPANAERRRTIRERGKGTGTDAWRCQAGEMGTPFVAQRRTVQQVFVVALGSLGGEARQRIAREAATHSDMLLLAQVDSYEALASKVALALQVITALDISYDYLLKTDDDTFVRADRLLAQLAFVALPNVYWGFFNYGTERHAESSPGEGSNAHSLGAKWADSRYNDTYYPPYAQGCGYALSRSLVQQIAARADPANPPSRLEDAATGIYLEDVRDVNRVEVWWNDVPAVKSGSSHEQCSDDLVLRCHTPSTDAMARWTRNLASCGCMCSCDPPSCNLTVPWSPVLSTELTYSPKQIAWIYRRKQLELERRLGARRAFL